MSKMYLNFLPIGGGGGLQNSLSFIENIHNPASYSALVKENTLVHNKCIERKIKTITVNNDLKKRFFYELFENGKTLRESTIFSIFGTPFLKCHKSNLNVNGFAVSNLLYPEINFWGFTRGLQRKKKDFIDNYRRYMYKKSDFWIFETEVLQDRAIKLFNFPEERTAVVKMAPSSLVSKERVNSDLLSEFSNKISRDKFNFLFLNGAHPNKQMHLLADIAHILDKSHSKEFSFVTTMNPNDAYTQEVMKQFKAKGLSKYIINIGPVPQHHVPSLIEACQAMCTFSVLESFSNNFIEAWKMKKPLLVTDADWSRAACRDSAIYVTPSNANKSAEQLFSLMKSTNLQQTMINSGHKILSEYPTPKEKNKLNFNAIEKAQSLGLCPQSVKKSITL